MAPQWKQLFIVELVPLLFPLWSQAFGRWVIENKICVKKIPGLIWCWYGLDFSVWSRFWYWSLGFCCSTVPVLVPQFWFLTLDIKISVQGFQVVICICLILALVRFHFGSILALFWPQLRWNLKLWYWNLNWLEPKLLKIFGTKIQKLRFFGIFGFRPTLINIHLR